MAGGQLCLVPLRNWKESDGFRLYDRKTNETESAYTGDYLYYEIMLKPDMTGRT